MGLFYLPTSIVVEVKVIGRTAVAGFSVDTILAGAISRSTALETDGAWKAREDAMPPDGQLGRA